MATIHMKVEAVRNLATSMGRAKAILSETMLNLHTNVNDVVGSAWISPCANEFQGDYDEWVGGMRQYLVLLASLQQRLISEVAEFEQTASKLS